MSANHDLFTRLINVYSNRYLEHKICSDLEQMFLRELREIDAGLKQSIPANSDVAPIIVLGMHRSGTTLVSKLLRESGILMGRLRGKDTDESLFFQNVNKAVFKLSGGLWDNPEPLSSFLESSMHKMALNSVLAQYCASPKKTRAHFSGSTLGKSSLLSMPGLWGWKDPRTCYTLPLWLVLFPKARILYINRNGVDVAQSLVVRNRKLGGKQPFSVNTGDLSGAFKLWEMYNQQCLAGINSLDPDRVHTLCYEELLASPKETLTQVFSFLKHDKPAVSINDLIKNIDSQKAYAFIKSAELIDFYEGIKETELMKQFGYDNISV